MNKKTKNMIIRRLRQASLASEERRTAKKNSQVGPATFQCNTCGVMIYEGTKDLNKAKESLPKGRVIKGKPHMDHKTPIVEEVNKDNFDWNRYVASLFSPVENWQTLCEECHDTKTEKENLARGIKKKIRRKNAKAKKTSTKSTGRSNKSTKKRTKN